MTRGNCFPGTIAPKIEYTASIEYVMRCMKCNRRFLNKSYGHKRFLKNLYDANNESSMHHQRPVCHTKQRQRCELKRLFRIFTIQES